MSTDKTMSTNKKEKTQVDEKKPEGKKAATLNRTHAAELGSAYKDTQLAQLGLKAVVANILKEMGLSPENIVELHTLKVLPPKGEEFLKEG